MPITSFPDVFGLWFPTSPGNLALIKVCDEKHPRLKVAVCYCRDEVLPNLSRSAAGLLSMAFLYVATNIFLSDRIGQYIP